MNEIHQCVLNDKDIKARVFFFFKKILVEIQLVYNIVLVSGIQQSDSVIHIHNLFRLFSIISYYKILNILPCAIRQVLVLTQLCLDSLRPPWFIVLQAPLAKGFSRQEYWSGQPFSSPDIQQYTSVNLKLLFIPTLSFPFGNYKFIFYVCKSISGL